MQKIKNFFLTAIFTVGIFSLEVQGQGAAPLPTIPQLEEEELGAPISGTTTIPGIGRIRSSQSYSSNQAAGAVSQQIGGGAAATVLPFLPRGTQSISGQTQQIRRPATQTQSTLQTQARPQVQTPQIQARQQIQASQLPTRQQTQVLPAQERPQIPAAHGPRNLSSLREYIESQVPVQKAARTFGRPGTEESKVVEERENPIPFVTAPQPVRTVSSQSSQRIVSEGKIPETERSAPGIEESFYREERRQPHHPPVPVAQTAHDRQTEQRRHEEEIERSSRVVEQQVEQQRVLQQQEQEREHEQQRLVLQQEEEQQQAAAAVALQPQYPQQQPQVAAAVVQQPQQDLSAQQQQQQQERLRRLEQRADAQRKAAALKEDMDRQMADALARRQQRLQQQQAAAAGAVAQPQQPQQQPQVAAAVVHQLQPDLAARRRAAFLEAARIRAQQQQQQQQQQQAAAVDGGVLPLGAQPQQPQQQAPVQQPPQQQQQQVGVAQPQQPDLAARRRAAFLEAAARVRVQQQQQPGVPGGIVPGAQPLGGVQPQQQQPPQQQQQVGGAQPQQQQPPVVVGAQHQQQQPQPQPLNQRQQQVAAVHGGVLPLGAQQPQQLGVPGVGQQQQVLPPQQQQPVGISRQLQRSVERNLRDLVDARAEMAKKDREHKEVVAYLQGVGAAPTVGNVAALKQQYDDAYARLGAFQKARFKGSRLGHKPKDAEYAPVYKAFMQFKAQEKLNELQQSQAHFSGVRNMLYGQTSDVLRNVDPVEASKILRKAEAQLAFPAAIALGLHRDGPPVQGFQGPQGWEEGLRGKVEAKIQADQTDGKTAAKAQARDDIVVHLKQSPLFQALTREVYPGVDASTLSYAQKGALVKAYLGVTGRKADDPRGETWDYAQYVAGQIAIPGVTSWDEAVGNLRACHDEQERENRRVAAGGAADDDFDCP